MLSNHTTQNEYIKDKEQICFLNYDLKNNFEKFDYKKNNPLQFSNQLYVEVEKTIPLSELIFDNNSDNCTPINLQQTVSKEEYIQNVNAIKKHIQAGDIYEINYCITFEAFDVAINPIEIYEKLNTISGASYSALAKLNQQYIICSSPELYLSKRGNQLITKPIKGTAKRGKVQEDDVIIREELQSNLKERNENVMIVDVARNDLSRVAAKGSVSVNKLYDIESYQQVHQMVSTVACEIKENIVFSDIIQATFPMASMTGAPKIRAMQLIDEFELYNRGPYSGALGYINKNNDFDLNVLIRSIFYDEEKRYLSFTVGSAITSLCNAEDEYNECLLKANAMIAVLNN